MLQTELAHILIVSAGLVPSLAMLWFFVCEDRHPEPPWAVWKAFFFGMGAVLIALGLGARAAGLHDALGRDSVLGAAVDAFILAGVFEEVAKWVILRWFANRNPAFDEPMDGIVFGVAIGLGFAVIEDGLYVARFTQDWVQMLPLRGLTAMPLHVGLGAITGYYVGTAKFPHTDTRKLNWAWWRAALLHGLYDFPIMLTALPRFRASGDLAVLWLWAAAILIAVCIEAIHLSRKLHAAQLAHPDLKDPLQLNHSWRAWAEMIGGSGLVAAVLGLGLALIGHRPDPGEPPLGGMETGVGLLIAAIGLLAGILLYRTGMRRVYRGAHDDRSG